MSPDPVSYTVNDADKKHISCKGGDEGSFKVTADGGTAPYTLWWERDDNSSFISVSGNILEVSGLKAGTYRYYVIDSNNCELEDPEHGGILYKSVKLTEPAESLAVGILSDKTMEPTGKNRSDGYITVQITGGTPPYTAVWKDKSSGTVLTSVDNTIADESKLYNISAGTYSVTVTDSKGCTLSTPEEFTLNEPDAIYVAVNQQGQILCYGDVSASLTVSVSGGNGGPYTYVWSKKENEVYIEISTSSSVNNLGAGDYKVSVSDSSTPPNVQEVEYAIQGPPELTASATKSDVSCKNASTGAITFSIDGGVAPYTVYYQERNEGGAYASQTANSSAFSITNLKAGYYNYYVTDANDCRAKIGTGSSGQITITEPDIALEIISSNLKNPTGAGRSDGSIAIEIEGGIPYSTGDKYLITWKKGGVIVTSGISLDEEDGIVTSKIEGITRGTYNVEIRDNSPSGCIITASFNLTDPPPISVSLEEINRIECFGYNTARIAAHVKGGTPRSSGLPYAYQWYIVEAGNDKPVKNGNDSILNNAGAGVYKVKIEDGATPPNTAESSVITISQPPALEATIVKTNDISCFGGSDGVIQLSVSGGSGGYKLFYKLTANTTYETLTASGSVFNVNNLPAGKYSLHIQDVNGCTALISGQEDAEVELIAPEKPLSVVSRQINTPSGQGRSDGSIMITVDGGTPFDSGDKYLVSWKDENRNPLSAESATDAQGLFTSKISNLSKGEYFVDIKDKNYQNTDNGCFLSASITLDEPPPLIVNVENTGYIKCFGDNSGELVAHAAGGVPYLSGLPYKYNWYSVTDGIETLLENKNDSILSGVPAGSYKLRIEDGSSVANQTESGTMTLSQPEELVTVVDTRMLSCHQGSDGYIQISVKGGTGSYRLYYKPNGTNTEYREITGNSRAYTFNLNNLPAGTYSIYVLDENSCHASINGSDISEIVLTQPDKALTILTDTVYDPTGYGLSNGEIRVQLDGGTPEYTVIWKDEKGNVLTAENSVIDGVFTSVLTGLSNGAYRIEVRDANYSKANDANNAACILTDEYEIVEPAELTMELEETHYVSCYHLSDGEITAHVKGGVKNRDDNQPLYKFTWYREEAGSFVVMPDRNSSILTNVPAGTYKVEIEDHARIPNKTSAVYQIVQPDLLTAVSEDVRVACGETAAVSVTVSGGTLPYAYKWNTGDETPVLSDMYPGKYMVMVTDARGCEVAAIARVISPSDLSVSAKINNPVCYQSANGSIIVQVAGGTDPYTYLWNTGKTTKDIANIAAGIYTVTVTDKDGCRYSESFELTDPEPLKVDLGEDITLCIGQSYILEPQVEDPKTVFSWTGPDGFQSADSKIELSRAGTYQVTITDSKGCRATDDVQVFVTDYGINSEMVVATDMFVNDTIVLVNISSPDPDSIEWLFSDKDPVEIVSATPEMAEIIFRKTGEYTVGMRAFVKDCYQDVIKTLTVTENNGYDTDNFGQTDILSFVAYPNPNDGSFRVKTELGKQSTIRLRLFSLVHGSTVGDRTLSGSNLYDEQYRMSLSPGVYILLLETTSGRKSQKIIIK